MTRFRSVLVAVLLAGCASPSAGRPSLRPSPPVSSAFSVDPSSIDATPEVWRQELDPAELLGEGVTDFPGPRLLDGEEPRPSDPGNPLNSILREFVAPGLWNPEKLELKDGLLVTTQPPAILAALRSALQTLRDNRQRMIRTEVRLHEWQPEQLARFENIPPVGGGLVGTFDRRTLVRAFADGDLGHSIQAPRLTTFHGQMSHTMFLTQTAYLAGYEPVPGRYEPTIRTTREGILTEFRSVANGKRADEFLISFDIQLASPTNLLAVPMKSGVAELPAQGYARLSGRCALRSKDALLIVMRNPYARNPDHSILAVTVTLDWAE